MIDTLGYLTPKEASSRYGLALSTVYKYVESGDLPSLRVGTSIRIPYLEEFDNVTELDPAGRYLVTVSVRYREDEPDRFEYTVSGADLRITYYKHATVLIQHDDFCIDMIYVPLTRRPDLSYGNGAGGFKYRGNMYSGSSYVGGHISYDIKEIQS